ncbi:MAG: heme ABC exporter ATP-binding protein CcmA [Armatimonadota bacterium]|nr:heme ABC exporter ATP-binding protein CcmA [Armatimonadota bacterium]
MISLKLCNIGKEYGQRKVFSEINAEAPLGSSLAITGRNGSGKSTLLRIIAGLIRPTIGSAIIEIDGKEASQAERRNLVGLVAPDLALYEELTALENLQFFTKVRGMNRGVKDLRELIARVGLAGREDEPLSSYSSGMKQRVKYAFALLHNPPILLLDEPTANLDAEGVKLVDEIITEHKKEGLLVLATNDKKEEGYGDQVIELGV